MIVNTWPPTVTLASRAPLVLAATVKLTVPLPLPLPPPPIVTHGWSLAAFQPQLFGADTEIVPDPPAAANERLVGLIEYEQTTAAAACVIVNTWPPTVTLASRAPLVLAATVKLTVPLPLPLPPPPIVTHCWSLTALQPQLFGADTEIVPEPPAAANDRLVGLIEYEQTTAAAACVIVNTWPAIVTRVSRAAPPLAATVKFTVPLPLPPEPIVTHESPPVAVQAQLADVETAMVPEPPDAVKSRLVGLIV